MITTVFLTLSVPVIITLASNSLSGPPLEPFYYFDVLLAQGIGETEKGNWVSSPASIKSALGLLLEASAKNTAAEICQVLRLPQDLTSAREKMHAFQKNLRKPAQSVDVKIGSRIMVRQDIGIKRKYRTQADEYYSALTTPFNVSEPWKVSNDINTWIKQQTDNYIPEIINAADITKDSLLLLVNAVYFKGDWKHPFNPQMTRYSCFYNPDCKKVQMMTTTGIFKSGEIPNLNSQIIELPYMNPRYSLIILLPKEINGLSRIIWDLPFNPIINILNSLYATEIDVMLPKFSINFNTQLIPILQKFGMKEVFGEKADLSELLWEKGKVSNFIHRAKIDVNEKGTKAGAASVVQIQLLSSSYRPRFDVNRPFFFFIRDSESGFMFEGQVVDPISPQVGKH